MRYFNNFHTSLAEPKNLKLLPRSIDLELEYYVAKKCRPLCFAALLCFLPICFRYVLVGMLSLVFAFGDDERKKTRQV